MNWPTSEKGDKEKLIEQEIRLGEKDRREVIGYDPKAHMNIQGPSRVYYAPVSQSFF